MYLSQNVDKVVDNFSPSEALCETLKELLRSKVSQLNYNNWFKPIVDGRLDGGNFVMTVPNKFIADWITDYYIELLEKEVSELVKQPLKIRFDVAKEEGEVVQTAVAMTVIERSPVVTNAVSVRPPQQAILNPKYNFESFVVGSGNQLAHAAAKSVADLPGGHYNPLYLYGGVGLGKTHLLNAVGLFLVKKNPDFKIIYVSSERFMNEFINGVRHDKMLEFRKKYRESCDMLLIDDIQFLGGKEGTQDEFFHTFNVLYESQRQIIVTSDKMPKEIAGLEERLRSRFEWGLIADIQPPDLETRIAILRKKAETDQIYLNNEITMFLASHIKSNVRELEGALIRLNAFATLAKCAITIDLAKEVFKNILPSNQNGRTGTATIETIQEKVALYYQIKVADLKSPRRMRVLAHPRQVAMYLCKKHLKASFPDIGNRFGGKDHTTVIHACRKIETLAGKDPKTQNEISDLEKTIL
ncbi:MAG: chromosomal replication initiator protein DnaA [Deltaproteobacteria bacterium]|nr:chromosomal replication initiator protein DnaA [Deltaproteobacteria bacterium]